MKRHIKVAFALLAIFVLGTLLRTFATAQSISSTILQVIVQTGTAVGSSIDSTIRPVILLAGSVISGIPINGVIPVTQYGAVAGTTPITCTSDGSTAVLTGCSSTAGWVAGTNSYALVVGGGISNTLSTPAAPTVVNSCTGSCTTPTHTYQYKVVDWLNHVAVGGGAVHSAASAASTTTGAVAALFPGSSNIEKNVLTLAANGQTYHEIYRSIDGGPYNKLDETASATYTDFGQPGADQNVLAFDDNATAPVAAGNETMNVNVTAVTPTTITVATAPTQATTVTLYDNNAPAFRAAVAAAAAQGGGVVYFPAGTYCVTPDKAATFGSTSNAVISMQGPTYSNIRLLGAGPNASQLRVCSMTRFNFAGPNTVFEIFGPTSSGGLAVNTATTALSATANAGDLFDAVASVSGFSPGDYALVRTAQNDPAAVINPIAEVEQVQYADATNNILNWAWPLSRTYVQEYFQTGTTGVSQIAPLYSTLTANASVMAASQLITCATNCPSGVATIFKAAVTLGGNIGASEPNWNGSCPSATNTCTDGNVTWTNLGTAAAQATVFGVADINANVIHDIQVRDLSVVAPQGGVQSSSGVRLFSLSQSDRVVFDNLVSRTGDIGAVGYNHDSSITNSTLWYERMGGAGSACCGANGVTNFIMDRDVFNAPQPLGFQFNEGTSGLRVTNSTFRFGFPAYPTLLPCFGGVGTYDALFANNVFYGHCGAGLFQFNGTGANHPTQLLNIYGNTAEAPFGASIPDAQTRNNWGSATIQDTGSNIANNVAYPANAWNGFQITGIPGFGNSNTGNNQAYRTCSAKVNYSQASVTTGTPLCTLPANSTIDWCVWKPTTTFNAATTNVISVGGSTVATTYVANTTFTGTTQVPLTLAAAASNITTAPPTAANNLTVYYSFTGTAPTAGVGIMTCTYQQSGQ